MEEDDNKYKIVEKGHGHAHVLSIDELIGKAKLEAIEILKSESKQKDLHSKSRKIFIKDLRQRVKDIYPSSH